MGCSKCCNQDQVELFEVLVLICCALFNCGNLSTKRDLTMMNNNESNKKGIYLI